MHNTVQGPIRHVKLQQKMDVTCNLNPQTVTCDAKDALRPAIPKLPPKTFPNETSISEIRDVDVLTNRSPINGGRGILPGLSSSRSLSRHDLSKETLPWRPTTSKWPPREEDRKYLEAISRPRHSSSDKGPSVKAISCPPWPMTARAWSPGRISTV